MSHLHRLMSSLCAGLATALLFPVASVAQQTLPVQIEVGSALVDGQRLQPYKNQWGMKLIRPDGTVVQNVGTWTDELETTVVDGKPCWKRTQVATYKRQNGDIAGTTTTINVFDKSTFAPVLRQFQRRGTASDSSDKISFAANSMKIEHTTEGKTNTSQLPTTAAFDFYGGIYAVLWAALPLREGFSATFPSYTEDEHPEKVTPVTYRVVGRETTDAGSKGKVDAWVIECDSMIGNLKYWVGDQAPYVIRMDYQQKQGPLWVLTMT